MSSEDSAAGQDEPLLISSREATSTFEGPSRPVSPSQPAAAPAAPAEKEERGPYWLPQDLVRTAFQLCAFLQSTGDSYLAEVPHDIGLTIEYICYKYRRPDPVLVASKTSRTTKRSSSEPLQFPSIWATDRPTLRRNVKAFSDRTVEFRKLPKLQDYLRKHQNQKDPDIPIASQENDMADNWQDTGFSQQQWTALQGLLRTVVNPLPQQQQQEQQQRHGQPANIEAAIVPVSRERWNAGDVGFYDPLHEGKSVSSASPIEHTGKDTFFRDVDLFIERAKEVATVKGGEMVRNNLWTCLRGTALEWWTAEVSDNEKRLSKYGDGNDLGEWSSLLVSRFKQPSHVAIDAVLRERYTMHDAGNRREPREYAQKILRSAKDAGLIGVKNQLDIIYNGMDPELRRDLKKPRERTKLNDFLEELDDFKHDWWTYAHRRNARMAPQSSSSSQMNRNNGQYQSQNRPLPQQQQPQNRPFQQQQQNARSGPFSNGNQYQQPRQYGQNAGYSNGPNAQSSRPFNGQNNAFPRPYNPISSILSIKTIDRMLIQINSKTLSKLGRLCKLRQHQTHQAMAPIGLSLAINSFNNILRDSPFSKIKLQGLISSNKGLIRSNKGPELQPIKSRLRKRRRLKIKLPTIRSIRNKKRILNLNQCPRIGMIPIIPVNQSMNNSPVLLALKLSAETAKWLSHLSPSCTNI